MWSNDTGPVASNGHVHISPMYTNLAYVHTVPTYFDTSINSPELQETHRTARNPLSPLNQ